MPGQAPPAPEGCVYGPWWDGVISRWLAITPTPSGVPHYWTHQWIGSDWRPYSSSERELLRLAKENAELRASQPREEGQAVLWLIREKGWAICRLRSDHRWLREEFESGEWERFEPIKEARKLGWGGGE